MEVAVTPCVGVEAPLEADADDPDDDEAVVLLEDPQAANNKAATTPTVTTSQLRRNDLNCFSPQGIAERALPLRRASRSASRLIGFSSDCTVEY
jgi:hypothetical protein